MHDSYEHLITTSAIDRWNREGARTSAFLNWMFVHDDIERFAVIGLAMIADGHDRMWKRAEAERGGDVMEIGERYEYRVGLLSSIDQEWMHLAAALKDAVSAFEVYLEGAIVEILAAHDIRPQVKPERLPNWWILREWFDEHLSIDINSDGIAEVREVRNILTHLRGELRTDKQRARWGASDSVMRRRVSLSGENLHVMMETLATKVTVVEDRVVPLTRFGSHRFETGYPRNPFLD